MTVVDARPRFARRTAEMCLNEWDRDTIIANVARLGPEQEPLIVEQIELLRFLECTEDEE